MSTQRASREQYATSDRLQTRISLHDKYSVNRQGFAGWIFEQYDLAPGARVLELGCGTGDLWKGRTAGLPAGVELVLSDLSPGMLETARRNLGGDDRVRFEEIDIQEIPHADASFDLVIANMMLYHVPDIDRGIGEARRVLRPGGVFSCATYGEHGMTQYLTGLLTGVRFRDGLNNAFTLQNGAARLERFFDRVERRLYPDELRVTNVADLVDYLYSLSGFIGLREGDRPRIAAELEAHMDNGALIVPKEYGVFLCS